MRSGTRRSQTNSKTARIGSQLVAQQSLMTSYATGVSERIELSVTSASASVTAPIVRYALALPPPGLDRSLSRLLACSDVKSVTRTRSKPSSVEAFDTRSKTVIV